VGPAHRILALAPALPVCPRDGVALRVHHLLGRLSATHDVTLVHFRAASDRPEVSAVTARMRGVVCDPPGGQQASGPRLFRAARLPSPYAPSASMDRAVRLLVSAERFDVVLAVHPAVLRHAFVEAGPPVVADLMDEPVLKIWRELHLARRPDTALRLVRRILGLLLYERALCSRAASCVVVGDDEARNLRRIVPTARIQVVPSGVDVDYFRPLDIRTEPHALLFSGNLDYGPNVAAIQYFHRRVWPRVLRGCPGAHWYIVGANPTPPIAALAREAGVSVTGFVPDLRPYLGRAAVVVSPLVSGSGIKTKVLEAWAMGKAVVATPLGCSGLQYQDGRNVALARSPDEFAQTTLTLLRDPARAAALGEAGRQTVCERYRWDTQADRLEAILREVVTISAKRDAALEAV